MPDPTLRQQITRAYASAPVTGTQVRCTRLRDVRTLPIGRTGDRCQFLDDNRTWQNFAVSVDRDGLVDLDRA